MYVGPARVTSIASHKRKHWRWQSLGVLRSTTLGFFFFHDTFDDCFQMDPSLSIWATRAFHFSLRQTKSIGSRTPTHAASGITHPGMALKMQQAFPKADERPSCLALQFLQGPFQIHVGFFSEFEDRKATMLLQEMGRRRRRSRKKVKKCKIYLQYKDLLR